MEGNKDLNNLEVKNLLECARKGFLQSYSHEKNSFRAGAAVLTYFGEMFSGSMIMNSSYPLTTSAIQTAITKAICYTKIPLFKLGEPNCLVKALGIYKVTNEDISIDGFDQQFLREFGNFPIYILNINQNDQENDFSQYKQTSSYELSQTKQLNHFESYYNNLPLEILDPLNLYLNQERINCTEIQNLAHQAFLACPRSYCPYSKFPVGCAILTKQTGKIFQGCNVENSCLSCGICAERMAICAAVSEGEKSFKSLFVLCMNLHGKFGSMCGSCRQIAVEFGDFDIYEARRLSTSSWEIRKTTIYQHLPHAFI